MAKAWGQAASRLLLDTNVLLWRVAGSSRLSRSARETVRDAEAVHVSAATVWEIAIKVRQGKLEFEGDLQEQLIPADSSRVRFESSMRSPLPTCRSTTATHSTGCCWRKPGSDRLP